MALQFTNPDVAAKYTCTEDEDRLVTKPQVYSGLLSNITLAMADAMLAEKHNLIALIPDKKAKAVPDEK